MSRLLQGVVLGALLTLTLHEAEARKPKATGTLKDLENREVTVDKQLPVSATPEQAAVEYRRFLELQGSAPQLRMEAMRRLGDLSLQNNENLAFADPTADMTQAELTEAITLYESLLAAYPDYANADAVLYQLARAYETANKPDDAMRALGQLIQRFPNSRWFAEAQFRRGELLFSGKQYRDAGEAYSRVVELGSGGDFYDQGLYKQGWSFFKQSRFDESVDTFLQLFDRVLMSRSTPATLRSADELSRPERELADDTTHVLAIVFADQEGPATLDELLAKRGDPLYAHQLYAGLGDLYLEKERYQDAAHAFTAFSKRRADSRYAPALQVKAIEAYQKGGFASRVLVAKQEFVELYAFDSKFWQDRRREDAPEVAALLKSNLLDLAQYFHTAARKNKKAEDYAAGVRWYRALLTSFPGDSASAENRYLLAELLFDADRFSDATAEYEYTAYEYPQHARSAAAGYAALVAYQKHEPSLQGAERAQWRRKFIDSEVKFATTFPEHPEAQSVLAKATEDLFAVNEFDRTIETANLYLQLKKQLNPQQERVVTTLLAHSLFDRARYAEAETAYLKVRTLLPANDAGLAELNERIAASIYKQAEAKQAAGDAGSAVDDFLRVVSLAPTAKISANAEFDAATALVAQGNWSRAIQVLEQFRRAHPEHELEPEVGRKLAVGYQETGRRLEAAVEYEKIAERKEETPDVRRAALWQAADLYRQAAKEGGQSGASSRAANAYARYIAQFPQPLDPAMDARQYLLQTAETSGDTKARDKWLKEIIQADRAAGGSRTARSRYLAARATLTLAAPIVADFNAIKLSAPLNKSLKQKRAAMEKALSSYGQALDYEVAEVTTAATYGMAELYRQMGADMLASERPKSLDADALEQYNVLLEEQAFPFEEKAIALHEANTRRAGDGLYDESVKKSFEVLAKLVPARYAKTEISEDHVPNLR